jgi:hypothetical protein
MSAPSRCRPTSPRTSRNDAAGARRPARFAPLPAEGRPRRLGPSGRCRCRARLRGVNLCGARRRFAPPPPPPRRAARHPGGRFAPGAGGRLTPWVKPRSHRGRFSRHIKGASRSTRAPRRPRLSAIGRSTWPSPRSPCRLRRLDAAQASRMIRRVPQGRCQGDRPALAQHLRQSPHQPCAQTGRPEGPPVSHALSARRSAPARALRVLAGGADRDRRHGARPHGRAARAHRCRHAGQQDQRRRPRSPPRRRARARSPAPSVPLARRRGSGPPSFTMPPEWPDWTARKG